MEVKREHNTDMCRAAASVLGVASGGCDMCPFPFCVAAEAGIVTLGLRAQMVRTLRELGNTVVETANALGVSTRSTYRYVSPQEPLSSDCNCKQCDLLHSQDVMCKSRTYTVLHTEGYYLTVLNYHRHATRSEVKSIECLVDYVFPSGHVERGISDHSYWGISRVELEEAKKFEGMCEALNQYIMKVKLRVPCLQAL